MLRPFQRGSMKVARAASYQAKEPKDKKNWLPFCSAASRDPLSSASDKMRYVNSGPWAVLPQKDSTSTLVVWTVFLTHPHLIAGRSAGLKTPWALPVHHDKARAHRPGGTFVAAELPRPSACRRSHEDPAGGRSRIKTWPSGSMPYAPRDTPRCRLNSNRSSAVSCVSSMGLETSPRLVRKSRR